MRNSFSLSVFFPTLYESDVKNCFQTIISLRKMKLVSILFLTITSTVTAVQDQFMFPPQFQTPNLGIFSTEKTIHLPPESPTPIPFFPNNNNNKIAFAYMPSSGTKSHVPFPSNFPHFMSSTTVNPINKDNNEEEEEDKRPYPTPQFLKNKVNPNFRNNSNFTDKEKQKTEKQERTPITNKINMHQPIDRIDAKFFNQYPINNGPTTPYGMLHVPTDRSMLISLETLNDQFKQGNYQNYPNMQSPKFYITPTTETAIPILRLSNEMDLDGSFSYEALGADQTHYVQHSRIDNFGTDNEGQVVEGSYSYVGDDGQTYTVNYTADSNGFRASGDHLPVPPPIPEIIQRSIQYNLAHEERKQPDMKADERESEMIESEKRRLFSLSPQRLFTGRTPESFSFGFSGYNTNNNLMSSASTQAPMKTNIEFMQNYMNEKPNPTIMPQITFLASQGAHVPSMNNPEQTVSTINSVDRPFMPQLINYEAPVKDNDREGNKGLWRWQYGINTESNPDPEKKAISRSYGEDDDVMINFGDMTPEQYANMIGSQFEGKQARNDQNHQQTPTRSYDFLTENNKKDQITSTEPFLASTQLDNWYKRSEITSIQNIENNFDNNNNFQQVTLTPVFRSKIITQHNYLPSTEIVTQSYNYDSIFYEPKRVKSFDIGTTTLPLEDNDKLNPDERFNKKGIENVSKGKLEEPHFATSEATPFKLTSFVNSDNKNDFKPLLSEKTNNSNYQQTIQTSSESFEELLKENIFIKNLFARHNNEKFYESQPKNTIKYLRKSDTETKDDKLHVFNQLKSSSPHETQNIKSKPIDIAHVLNYISSKNQFESNKIRPKSKSFFVNLDERDESPLMRLHQSQNEDQLKIMPEHNRNDFRNRDHQEEIRGMIKNYKVLQRNNGVYNKEKDDNIFNRILIPPQGSNLPPLGRAGPTNKNYLPPIYA